MKKHAFYWLALGLLFIVGCQKELSFELGNTPSKGSLTSDITGDCLPKTVNGTYGAGIPLVPTTNTITVQVNVTRTGTYVVNTDTINGYFFRTTGTFTTLGANNVTLRGNGTPFAAGIDNFVVRYDTTICDIQVTVTSPGVGTLAGAPNACTPITVNGSYSPGVALTSSNNAVVQVNVTTAGLFNITTDTVAGIWFTFSGALPLGAGQNVTLQAQGSIPAATATGAKIFKVKLGASQCTFTVNVAGPAVGTVNCGSATFTGSYNAGVPMTSANTVTISVTITTPGAYNITTDTVNGVWFNASGNFPTAITTTLILTGNGTPLASGPFIYTVKWGTSNCTFTCTYSAAPVIDYFPRTTNSNWSYEWNDDPTDSVLRVVLPATLSVPPNTYNIFMPDEGNGPDTSATSNYSAGYYRKNGGDYFERIDLGNSIFDAPVWGEYTMLKDNVAAPSAVWTSSGFSGTSGGTPLKIRFSYKVTDKDVPISITSSTGTTNFTNVIVVLEKYEIEILPGVWQDATPIIGYSKSYYARNIGLILFEVFDPTNTRTDWQELRRYQVF